MGQDGARVVVEDPAAFIQAGEVRGKGVNFFKRVDGDRDFMMGTCLMDHGDTPSFIGRAASRHAVLIMSSERCLTYRI
jgi:hypothetical protein